jgi:predicted N-formylglutamate amidohydrolase
MDVVGRIEPCVEVHDGEGAGRCLIMCEHALNPIPVPSSMRAESETRHTPGNEMFSATGRGEGRFHLSFRAILTGAIGSAARESVGGAPCPAS